MLQKIRLTVTDPYSELFVIAKSSAKYVEEFDLKDKVGNTRIKWEHMSTIPCSDCGELEGEKRQFAICHYLHNGQWKFCEGFDNLKQSELWVYNFERLHIF